MGRHPIVVVAGTGTEVGKTHVAANLLAAWGRGGAVIGYKPVETGVRGGAAGLGEDSRRLARTSTFHVKHPVFRYAFEDPISPHLAARREGVRIDLSRIAAQARRLAADCDGVLLELAGGLFTPLGTSASNADLVRRVKPDRLVVVAPDRLGVLHDVAATIGAAIRQGIRTSGVVLSAPEEPDASTGTNAAEIAQALRARVLAYFPRASARASVTRRAARILLEQLDLLP